MILVTGADGLLGSACHAHFARLDEVVGTRLKDPGPEGFVQCDLTDHDRTRRIVLELAPDTVIHAAACKDVRQCERNPEACRAINAEATAHLAGLARRVEGFLVYISTDHVFDGESGRYDEETPPNPTTRYGVTKAEGEVAVGAAGGAICRTSGLYGWNSPTPTFLEFVVDGLRRGRRMDLYTDILNSPTYVPNLCEMLERVVALRRSGIYHTAGPDRVSRHEFGVRIARAFGLDRSLVRPVPAPPEEAWRPRDVSLDTARTRRLLKGVPFLGIEEGLARLKADHHVST